ncbi:NUDIX domain-containing protein [Candidatus Peregrinibacteria bacterium]|nr:NUDIX domain-containing protein [Candidatus Peregrinibacteria bacterium]
MVSEKSCGIVLINRGGGTAQGSEKPKFLLLHYPQGHWDFPKGHTEAGEDESATARRELIEETGIIDVKFYDGFCEKIHYFFKQDGKLMSKNVIFFLAETNTAEVKLSHEHKGFEWLAYEEARKKLTFNDSRKVLEKVWKYLGGRG